MRVGLAVPAFLPATGYGGPVWNTLRLARALAAEGIEPVVLTSTLSAPGRPDLRAGPDAIEGLAVERMPVWFARRWSPWVRWQKPQAPIDVLHVFGLWNGLSYSAVHWAGRAEVPWVWEPSGMLAPRGRKAAIKRLLTAYHARLARRAAGVIWTAPQESAEAPEALRGVHCWLRPNPAPELPAGPLPERGAARRALGLPVDAPLWGYFGRVAARKGIERLLDCWAEAQGPGTLCIAGPVEDLALGARARGAGPSVVLKPPLAADERWSLLRALDALVLVPDFGENFGLVVVEAIAAGTPAVVSPAVGAGHWLAGHGAVVVDPPAQRLVEMFSAGAVPRVACSIPEALSGREVGRLQARIYREAVSRKR